MRKSNSNEKKIAVYVDRDNIKYTVENSSPNLFLDYHLLKTELEEELEGEISLFKVICSVPKRNLSRDKKEGWKIVEDRINTERINEIRGCKRKLSKNMDIIYAPQFTQNDETKSVDDSKLILEAIKDAQEREEIDIFVICTEDKDFLPLLTSLSKMNRGICLAYPVKEKYIVEYCKNELNIGEDRVINISAILKKHQI